ncbi:MAG: aspartate/glutamate racemase family protein [Candidatus Accumulibacter sp.]|jgi:aspartate racemase|nr:aspartate/glutamate racemase family protein [Accumulibacter sp.]
MDIPSEKRRHGFVDWPGAVISRDRFAGELTARFGEKALDVLLPRVSTQKEKPVPGIDPWTVLKIRTFDAVREFEALRADAVLLPAFASRAFIEEIEAETALPIVSPMDALRAELSRQYPSGGRIGVLGVDRSLFERHFPEKIWTPLYPERDVVNGREDALADACRDLARRGAESIIAGDVALPFAQGLRERGFPVVDVLRVYVGYAAALPLAEKARPFKIGVVGGVGPAATVDLLDKIVRNTPARRDQEHLKVAVEMNPQIPDRTAYLLDGGADPTVALYAACKRLEATGASVIAIPCNTAHAFVGRIQPFLSIPIVNMLRETAEYIRRNHGGCSKVGLLATSGTIDSRVYHEAIGAAGFETLVPDAENQERVMNAIYGPRGVKAGFTEGECVADLSRALASLVERGAEAVILGCTELPLLLARNEAFPIAGKTVAVLDPTDILAKKCVDMGWRAAGKSD